MDQQQIQQNFIQDLGLGELPEDKRQEIVAKMGEILLKRIFIETMNSLDDEGKKSYESLIEKKATPEEIENFLKVKIFGYEKIVEKIIADFKQEMINEIK